MERIIEIIYRLGLIVIWGSAAIWLVIAFLGMYGTWDLNIKYVAGATMFLGAPLVAASVLHLIWRWLLFSVRRNKENLLIPEPESFASKPEPLKPYTGSSANELNEALDYVTTAGSSAEQGKVRVAHILSESGLSSALDWLMDPNNLREFEERSSKVKVDHSKKSSDFPGCEKVSCFTYLENFYELFCENEKSDPQQNFETLIGPVLVNVGEFRMMIDGELVLKMDYQNNLTVGEGHLTGFRLQFVFSDASIKKVEKGMWLADLLKLAKLSREATDEAYFELSREIREEKSKEQPNTNDLRR
jgi:hypothetical protein